MTIAEQIAQLAQSIQSADDLGAEAELLKQLLDLTTNHSPRDTATYANRLLQIAKQLSDTELELRALNALASFSISQDDYNQASSYIEEMMQLGEREGKQDWVATAYQQLASMQYDKHNFAQSLAYNRKALEMLKSFHVDDKIATAYLAVGCDYMQLSSYADAMDNFLKALHLYERLDIKKYVGLVQNNIGLVLERQGDYQAAIESHKASLKVALQMGDAANIAASYNNLGNTYGEMQEFAKALEFFQKALQTKTEANITKGLALYHSNISAAYEKLNDLEKAMHHAQIALQLNMDNGNTYGAVSSKVIICNIYINRREFDKAVTVAEDAWAMAVQSNIKEAMKNAAMALSGACHHAGKHEDAYTYHVRFHELERELLNEQTNAQVAQLRVQHEVSQKERLLELEHRHNSELTKEKERAEALLLNILPASVADELKAEGKSKPRKYRDVTVLFSDFKNFTAVSERLSPEDLVSELHECFSAFDAICNTYGIEKIKTVGDAYVAVCGLPAAVANHAEVAVTAALEMHNFIAQRKHDKPNAQLDAIRIGLHSGEVIAGIVGINKFAYDIWGDTVNTAARMEQNGVPGMVNISEATYQLVNHAFNCEYRGEIEAKNKGQLKMYFVNGNRE